MSDIRKNTNDDIAISITINIATMKINAAKRYPSVGSIRSTPDTKKSKAITSKAISSGMLTNFITIENVIGFLFPCLP